LFDYLTYLSIIVSKQQNSFMAFDFTARKRRHNAESTENFKNETIFSALRYDTRFGSITYDHQLLLTPNVSPLTRGR